MTDDERLVRRLRVVDEPVAPDPTFAEDLYASLAVQLGFEPVAGSRRSRHGESSRGAVPGGCRRCLWPCSWWVADWPLRPARAASCVVATRRLTSCPISVRWLRRARSARSSARRSRLSTPTSTAPARRQAPADPVRTATRARLVRPCTPWGSRLPGRQTSSPSGRSSKPASARSPLMVLATPPSSSCRSWIGGQDPLRTEGALRALRLLFGWWRGDPSRRSRWRTSRGSSSRVSDL